MLSLLPLLAALAAGPDNPAKPSPADKAIQDAVRSLEAAARAEPSEAGKAKLRAAIAAIRAAAAAGPIPAAVRDGLVRRLSAGYGVAKSKAGGPIPKDKVLDELGTYCGPVRVVPLKVGEAGGLRATFGTLVVEVLGPTSAIVELQPGGGVRPRVVVEGIDTSGLADGVSVPPVCAVCITGTRKVGGTTYFVMTAFKPTAEELATIMGEKK